MAHWKGGSNFGGFVWTPDLGQQTTVCQLLLLGRLVQFLLGQEDFSMQDGRTST